jgi:hypothetical protein
VKVKTYDCTSGGAQWCQGCYTMTEQEPCAGFPRGTGDWVRIEDYEKLEALLEKTAQTCNGELGCKGYQYEPDEVCKVCEGLGCGACKPEGLTYGA